MAGNTQYVYAPDGTLIGFQSNTGTNKKMFVPLPMARAVFVSGTSDHYDRYDWQGSARVASTASRTLYSDTSYDAFGIPYWSSGASNNQYAGLTSDISSGTEQVSATRRYHPTQGRWIAPDASIPNLYNPQTFNGYHYALNQPTNVTDPGGNCDDPISYPVSSFGDSGPFGVMGNVNVPDGCNCDSFFGYFAGYDPYSNTYTPWFIWPEPNPVMPLLVAQPQWGGPGDPGGEMGPMAQIFSPKWTRFGAPHRASLAIQQRAWQSADH